jgi:hypothetical protein
MKNSYDNKKEKSVTRDENFTDAEDIFSNDRMRVPKTLASELEALGYVTRWLNEADFRTNGNMHRSGWLPYNAKAVGEIKSMNRNKIDAEGLYRNGDLILGIRPKSLNEKHAGQVREKNARLAGYTKEKAKEFREFIKSVDPKAKVSEGYNDND